MNDHELVPGHRFEHVTYERRPVRSPDGAEAEGLVHAWIWLDNPRQLNSYTTGAVKELILAFRRASAERDVVAVVFTAVGERSFCTGGNTAEYADVYAGRPTEYRQYMRLFNDMVTAILECDKPVVNRVNGMRIAGGQEIGMACDFSVAADDTRFGQAGPKHGSAPVGGSTDFLPLYVGFARAMESATLCETWTAYEALRFGLVNDIAPVWKENGEFVPFPLVVTDRWLDDHGRIVYGAMKTGADRDAAKARLERCTHDFARLDAAVETLAWKLALTMPECLTKTIEEVRRHKVAHWHANREANRAWLALNMNTEGKAGFRAFHHGEKGAREVDFLALRRAIAAGREFDDALIAEISPHRRAGAREA